MLRFVPMAMLIACTSAAAQPHAIAYHHLSFKEVNSITGLPVANPNGIIEPGESALISFSMSFAPGIGSPYGGNPSHPIRALRSSFFSLNATVDGSWSNLQLAPGWDAFGPISGMDPRGTPLANGRSVGWILPFQLPDSPDTANPVQNIWQALWTPDRYALRDVLLFTYPFGINGFQTASQLWLNEDPTWPQGYVTAPAYTEIAEMWIPMNIPTPGTGIAIIFASALFAARRHR